MTTMTKMAIIKECIKTAVIGAALAGNIASAQAQWIEGGQDKAPQAAAINVLQGVFAITSATKGN